VGGIGVLEGSGVLVAVGVEVGGGRVGVGARVAIGLGGEVSQAERRKAKPRHVSARVVFIGCPSPDDAGPGPAWGLSRSPRTLHCRGLQAPKGTGAHTAPPQRHVTRGRCLSQWRSPSQTPAPFWAAPTTLQWTSRVSAAQLRRRRSNAHLPYPVAPNQESAVILDWSHSCIGWSRRATQEEARPAI
jgi:hypothetical protein